MNRTRHETYYRMLGIGLAALAGGLFGAGLLVSGMTDPANVVGFLDPLSSWNPSLAFVIGGAVAVNMLAFRWLRRRSRRPLLDHRFHLPTRHDIDRSLIAGSAIFGIGWGLGGLCPGPGLVAAASGSSTAIAFVIAMLAGMFLQFRLAR